VAERPQLVAAMAALLAVAACLPMLLPPSAPWHHVKCVQGNFNLFPRPVSAHRPMGPPRAHGPLAAIHTKGKSIGPPLNLSVPVDPPLATTSDFTTHAAAPRSMLAARQLRVLRQPLVRAPLLLLTAFSLADGSPCSSTRDG